MSVLPAFKVGNTEISYWSESESAVLKVGKIHITENPVSPGKSGITENPVSPIHLTCWNSVTPIKSRYHRHPLQLSVTEF